MSRCAHVDARRGQCLRGEHLYGFHQYTLLAAVGAKKKRERRAEDAARDAVKLRSDGWCEAHTRFVGDFESRRRACGTVIAHLGVNAHHVFPEDRAAGRHDPERMLWLCAHAHRAAHAAGGHDLGLLRVEVMA